MTALPNINLSRSEVNILLKHAVAEGGEALICQGIEADSLSKMFLDPHQRNFTANHTIRDLTEMSDNKFHKIDELYQQDIDYMVRPLYTISCDDKLLGYGMTHDKNDIALNMPITYQKASDFAYYALASQDILQYFNQLGIVYGDVATRNILVNRKTRTAKFCDIDNIQYQDYPIDTLTRDLRLYEAVRGIDNETDAYMHNLMLLKRFYLEPLDADTNEDLCLDYFTEPALPIFKSMIEPEDFKGQYAAKYIKTRR